MWPFKKKLTEKPAELKVEAAIKANPVTFNPGDWERFQWMKWRIGHLERWLAVPTNLTQPDSKVKPLIAEVKSLKAQVIHFTEVHGWQ